jgi:hypothetical protein
MVSTVASLDDRCLCTVPSVEDDGSGYCGMSDPIGGMSSNVIQREAKIMKMALRTRVRRASEPKYPLGELLGIRLE